MGEVYQQKNDEKTRSENNVCKLTLKEKEQTVMKYKNVTIRKQPKGNNWYARYRQDGKQHYISAPTQKECYILLKSKLDNIETEKFTNNTYTFKQWYFKWLELFKIGNVRETTLKEYEYLMKNVNVDFSNKYIPLITSIEVIELLNKITASRQRQKVYELLKDIFNRAFLMKVINDDPMTVIEKPKHITKRARAMTITEEELFTHHALQNKYGLFYMVCLYQGLRRGECMALTYSDFDFNDKTINISKSINENTSDTRTKNKHSHRTMPLFEKTIELLKGLKVECKDERIFNVSQKPLHENFKSILKKAGLPDFTLHELRHTFITRCKEKNIPEFVVQGWVGHQIGSKVTSTVYTHINEETNNKYIDVFNG